MIAITVLQFQAGSVSPTTAPPALGALAAQACAGNYLPVAEVTVDTDDVAHAMDEAYGATNDQPTRCAVRELMPYRRDIRSTMPGDLMVVKHTGEVHIVLASGTAKVADHVCELISTVSGVLSSPEDALFATFRCPVTRVTTIKAVRSAFGLGLAEAKNMVEAGSLSFVTDRARLCTFVLNLIGWLAECVRDERYGLVDPGMGTSSLSFLLEDFEVRPVTLMMGTGFDAARA